MSCDRNRRDAGDPCPRHYRRRGHRIIWSLIIVVAILWYSMFYAVVHVLSLLP